MWSTVEKILIPPLNFHWKHWKRSISNLIYVTGIYFFVLSAVNFAEIPPIWNSSKFNLLVIFLIVSIKFCKNIIQWLFTDLWNSTLFYSENLLCTMLANIQRYERFPQFLHMSYHIAGLETLPSRMFPQEFSPKKIWSKISHGDKSTSSQTSTYFLFIFLGKKFNG